MNRRAAGRLNRGRLRRLVGRLLIGAALVVVAVVGCVPARGGWPVDALLEKFPELTDIAAQRIGDLTPYPALAPSAGSDAESAQLALVACRFPTDAPIVVRSRGAGWPEAWPNIALGALGTAVGEGLVFELDPMGARPVDIEVHSIEASTAKGPRGLGDTLAECDVTPGSFGPDRIARGEIVRSEIRMRRQLPTPVGRVHVANDAEWTGAFLHELAHAIGFAGHVAQSDSIVQREQSVLRRLGRRVLEGRELLAPSLRALYRIDPGTRLGSVQLSSSAEELLASVQQLVERYAQRLGPATGPFSSAGDIEARLVWRWPGGIALGVRMPNWRSAIADGEPLELRATVLTRRALARDAR